jgi:hypothetical protein
MLMIALLFLLPITNAIRVLGNQFIDDNGNKIILRGVSHSGSEYGCVQKGPIMEGQVDASAVAAIKSWGNNVVRIPLNEDCWLAINGVRSDWAGEKYQAAIKSYVDFIVDAGLVAILDLHWTADGGRVATGQDPMPNMDHSPTFWKDVATKYAGQSNVMFELFNEPFPGKGDTSGEWPCWSKGDCPGSSGVSFRAAGMDSLIKAVRDAGANNTILLGGLVWSNFMDGWLDNVPADPLNNTAAVWHSYDFNACVNQDCWEKTIKPISEKHPVIVTESGFKIDYVQKLWPWLESNGLSYMAWVWNTWGERNGEGLITSYDGTPSQPWGQAWKSQIAGKSRFLK